MGAAEIRDELSNADAVCITVENDRIVQGTRGDAAIVFGVDARQAAVGERIIVRLDLANLLLGRESQVLCRLNCRMVLRSNLFRFFQAQALGSLRSLRNLWNLSAARLGDQHSDAEQKQHSISLFHRANSAFVVASDKPRCPYTSRYAAGTTKIVNATDAVRPPMITRASGA